MANKNDIDKMAGGLMGNSAAEKLASKKDVIQKLADTQDAQRVKEIVNKDSGSIAKAMKAGDITSLKGTLDNILKTEEGARLVKKINDMMK